MKKQKYTAKAIAREVIHLAADGSMLTEQPTFQEAMIDAGRAQGDRKYLFVELYRNIGDVAGNTLSALADAAVKIAGNGSEIFLHRT